MLKRLACAAIAAHGLIHLIGFVVPWGIAQVDGFPYRTAALGGAIALGDAGARLLGVAWLLLAIGFVVAAVATWRGAAFAAPLLAGLAVASVVACTLALPEAAFGVAVNLAILGRLGWSAVTRQAPGAVA
jgi:hypothetical protein